MLIPRSLGIVFLLLLVAVGASAQSINTSTARSVKPVDVSPLGGAVTVTAPTTFSGPGVPVTLNITASDTTGQNITGFEAQIQYDSSVMVPVGPNAGCSSIGTIFASGSVTCNNNFPAPNVISVFVFGVIPVTGAGPILRLNFQVVGSAGTVSPLVFNAFIFNEGDPADVTVNGSLTVLGPTAAATAISGRVVAGSGAPIRNALIVLEGAEGERWITISNPFGFYRFEGIPAGEVYVISATSKRYRFEPRTIAPVDDVTDLDFIGSWE